MDEETGLIYAKARFYDPDIGRFLTQDSFLGDVTNVPSLHRYAYAFSNPLVFFDPTGNQTESNSPTAAKGMTSFARDGQLVVGAYETSVTVNCNQYGCTSSEKLDREINGVVRESMAGDEEFRERMFQVVGQVFGGHLPETPDWQKNWYVNFTAAFADDFAMTLSEPALRTQYGILHDDAKEIAIGVVEQIGAAVIGRGIAAGGEKVAASAIARYPWLAKPLTEAFRDASKGLKGQLQKQSQRVVKFLEEYVARRSGRIGAPGSANSGGGTGAPVSAESSGQLPITNSHFKPANYRGEPIEIAPEHTLSPRDLPIGNPPRVARGPFTTAERNALLRGTGGDTKLAPHHRHQVPTSRGGVIDEIPGPGHPQGNLHTAGSPSRHPSSSIFRNTKGGEALRKSEIRAHWKAKGARLVETEPGSGIWFDPGVN
jgi:RHS repeat-associated protein